MVVFYESVKSAQQVQVDEIPLPQLPQQQPQNTTASIPLPAEKKQEHTIYSIATAMKLQALVSINLVLFWYHIWVSGLIILSEIRGESIRWISRF